MAHTLLLIQDDPVSAGPVLESLRSSTGARFIVEWVYSCHDAIKRLTREADSASPVIDAVMVDLHLRDSNGIETFDRLFRASPQVPILVVTASAHESIARLAVQRGAQDYVLKEHLDSDQLPRTVASMIERATISRALHGRMIQARAMLDSIGDAVISADTAGTVTYLNAVAQRLTGWTEDEAIGRPAPEVFHIIDATTRETAQDPMAQAIRENRTLALKPDCILIRRDGAESAIEDSVAPIRDDRGLITGAVMVFRDVSEALALSQRMAYLAQHDTLTALPNRVMFKDRLHQAMTLADRQDDGIAILYVDLDGFKDVNDTLGHGTGDVMLRTVANRLRSCVRTSDTISRHGGDEFVVMLPQIADARDAEVTARNILHALCLPFMVDKHELRVTASIGIAIYPDDGTDIDTLLRKADLAMYRSKSGGRNRCGFYKPEARLPPQEGVKSGKALSAKA